MDRFFQDEEPPKLVSDQVLDFLFHQQIARELEGSTVNQAVCSLRNFYRDHLGLDWDIWKKIKIKRSTPLPHVLTREEVDLLLSSIRENRFRALFTVIYQCGLRLSEATHIAPKNINGKRLIIRIKGKGGKWREVPITAELYQKLRHFWSAHRNPNWLFAGTSGQWKKRHIPLTRAMRECSKPMSHASIYATLKVVLAETGLLRTHEKITPHTLRHSYATHLLDAGASVRQVSAYLGHSSLKDTMVYLHLTEISEEKARKALYTLPGL